MIIKPSPTFLTSALNLILPSPMFSYLHCICPCHGDFGYFQNFCLDIENCFLIASHCGKAKRYCMLFEIKVVFFL